MEEEKIVKVMGYLYWFFLILLFVSIPIKGILGWTMLVACTVLTLGALAVQLVFERRVRKKAVKHIKELLEASRSSKL